MGSGAGFQPVWAGILPAIVFSGARTFPVRTIESWKPHLAGWKPTPLRAASEFGFKPPPPHVGGYLFSPLQDLGFAGMFSAMANPFRAKPLTPARIGWAMAIAVIADGIQFMAGPLGWVGFDQAVDVVAMILTSLVLGFHPLLLPTFVVELVPLVDLLPTWTGCVGAVVLLRKRSQAAVPPIVTTASNPPADSSARKVTDATGPVIDV